MGDWSFLNKREFLLGAVVIPLLITLFLGKSRSTQQVSDSPNSITTQNQRGDNILITPNRPSRILDKDFEKEIDNWLSKYDGKKIIIRYLAANSEVYDFTKQIENYLLKKSYEVSLISVLPFDGKMEGQSAYVNEDILIFEIGSYNI